MITAWDIYWITQMDTLRMAALVTGALGTFVTALITAAFIADRPKNAAYGMKSTLSMIACVVCVLLLIGSAFIPSTKGAAAMFIIPKIANNEQVQELPGKLVDLADEWVEELRPKKDD